MIGYVASRCFYELATYLRFLRILRLRPEAERRLNAIDEQNAELA